MRCALSWYLRSGFALGLALTLTACGDEEPDGSTPGTTAGGSGADEDTSGGDSGGDGDDGLPTTGGDGDDSGGDNGDDSGGDGDDSGDDNGDDSGGDGDGDDGDDDGEPMTPWEDPYPDMPDENQFPEGSSIQLSDAVSKTGHAIEYKITNLPPGDTADLPLIVSGDQTINKDAAGEAILVEISYRILNGTKYNEWMKSYDTKGCSPVCTVFHFMDPQDLVQIMNHIGTNLRFDHRRVSFIPTFMMHDPFRTALSTAAQPYFAGVAVNHAEWQQADCPGLNPPGPTPPEVLFQVNGCDDSFCPLYECTQTIQQTGWDHAEIKMGTSLAQCPCPTPKDREHYKGRGPYAPILDFLLTVSR